MTNKKTPATNDSEYNLEALLHSANDLLFKNNDLKEQRNELEKQKYIQTVLDYEQRERQFLIEKSKLQPRFRLKASELLLCEPDFVNDPEQASEASFLVKQGVQIDERVLKLRIESKDSAQYTHPCVLYCFDVQAGGQAYALSSNTYFINLHGAEQSFSMNIYFVYKDSTTLPVIHKYHLMKGFEGALQRWSVEHVDTVFTSTAAKGALINTVESAEAFFN